MLLNLCKLERFGCSPSPLAQEEVRHHGVEVDYIFVRLEVSEKKSILDPFSPMTFSYLFLPDLGSILELPVVPVDDTDSIGLTVREVSRQVAADTGPQ